LPDHFTGAQHAVIADEGGGRNALAAAEVLAEAGVRITVVTGDPAVAEQVDGTVRTQLYRFLLKRGVEFRPMETVTGLARGKVITCNVYTRETGEIADVDLLVDWRGSRVISDLETKVRARFAQVEVVGDSLAPRTVQIATAEGADAARRIGR
jgi:NADH dehydrogenase FAD-containing subunit